jgi:hypothetical protein
MNNSGVTRHHPGLADGPIYLDYNATTPVDPRVAEAVLPYLTTHFGNPSSGHGYAEQPRRALAEARQQLADLIGAQPAEMVFTAGGSEADNLAIRGTVLARGRTRQVNDGVRGLSSPCASCQEQQKHPDPSPQFGPGASGPVDIGGEQPEPAESERAQNGHPMVHTRSAPARAASGGIG